VAVKQEMGELFYSHEEILHSGPIVLYSRHLSSQHQRPCILRYRRTHFHIEKRSVLIERDHDESMEFVMSVLRDRLGRQNRRNNLLLRCRGTRKSRCKIGA